MNKVIAALDALNLSESTIDYAILLARKFNAHIVAAFLEDIGYHQQPYKAKEEPVLTDWSQVDVAIVKEEEIRAVSKKKVQQQLDAEGVHYNVHLNKFIGLELLIKESRYADLILINKNESFSTWDSTLPSRFMRNVLSDAECPLLAVPSQFTPLQKVVFAYDGNASSVYAIKQFCYLFENLEDLEIEILMITDDMHNNHLPNQHLLRELLKRKHKTPIQSVIRSSDTYEALVDHLKTETKNCMLVMGAYQRSTFSRWLYHSMADAAIAELDIPVFIAHK